MNVQIKHQGTNITGYVVSYQREHKICTGIGTLTVEIDRTIPRSFSPWQTIDIHENGDFKVRYYISSIDDSQPKGTLVLDCQDVSKRLVDYFIPDSYTIDYPSYTGYWIAKFLTEAGLSYEFSTGSTGTLISNYTQLGLTSAYEQLITLLQMSGWYMYFDGNGKAIIGSLNVNLADDVESVGKTDILKIQRVSDDKMLRNRALVFGTYDAYAGALARAEVTVHTPWNYDNRDLRTVVISNSNIPNKGVAFGMANQIIKEFARITVEKHITLWGARDFNLGTALRVKSKVWSGKGLITTFGTSMDKDGLVTNIILDERCPRLFGYFDFGDNVYVATYGDGVWKKHIQFDNSWTNFSDGLTNLNITDMHINNGVFGSVGNSGQLYYAIDTTPWHQIATSGLWSSQEDTVTSSGEIIPKVFSGLMSRAVIVDKLGNTLKFGIDSYSGMNTGDYFITNSGVIGSGITSSGVRGWIVEYDILNGDLVGTSYPISLSGNYAFHVLDLENDGKNDYVSVSTGTGRSIPKSGDLYNFGHHYTQPFASTTDSNTWSVNPLSPTYVNSNPQLSIGFSSGVANTNSLVAVDDAITGHRKVMTIGKTGVARLHKIEKIYNIPLARWEFQRTQTTSSVNSNLTSSSTILGIYPDWEMNSFTIYYTKLAGSPLVTTYFKIIWNATLNSFGSPSSLGDRSGIISTYSGKLSIADRTVVIDNIIYNLFVYANTPGTSGGYYASASDLHIYMFKIDMATPILIQDHILQMYSTLDTTAGHYYFFTDTTHLTDGGVFHNNSTFSLTKSGNGVQVLGWVELYVYDLAGNYTHDLEYIFSGNDTVVQSLKIWDDTLYRFGVSTATFGCALTENGGFIGKVGTDQGFGYDAFFYNGTQFTTYANGSASVFPYYRDPAKILPVLSSTIGKYIAQKTTAPNAGYYLCDAASMSVIGQISNPTGYHIDRIFSSPLGTFGSTVYSELNRDLDGESLLAPYDLNGTFYTAQGIFPTTVPASSRAKGVNFGYWFITEATDYSISDPLASIVYIDLGEVENFGTIYQLLRRDDETSFTLIEEELYPMRADISNNAPVLTVGSGTQTFVSNYVYDTELVVIEAVPSGQAGRVDDYRYTFLEPAFGGLTSSGLGVSSMILYVSNSGVFGADAATYSGGFQLLYGVPSGYGARIETSNYGVGGQYVFITASGNVQTFYQKNPDQYSFTEYPTNFPQSRATIIRLDDRV